MALSVAAAHASDDYWPTWPAALRWMLLLGIANALLPNAIGVIDREGFWGAVAQTFGISMVTVAAAAVAWVLLARAPQRQIGRGDWYVLGLFAVVLAVPVAAACFAALVMLGLHAIRRDRDCPEIVAAATLFAGIGVVNLMIGPVFHLLSQRLLAIDATLVATVLNIVRGGAVHEGNLVNVPWGQSLAVAVECASANLVLEAILCWMTILRLFQPIWRRADLLAVPVIVLLIVVINIGRMAAMGLSPASYHLVHGQVGIYVVNLLCILVPAAAAWTTLAYAPQPARRGR